MDSYRGAPRWTESPEGIEPPSPSVMPHIDYSMEGGQMVEQFDHMKATGTLALTPVEADWLDTLKRDACEIASVFGVPAAISYDDIQTLKEELKLHESNQPIYDWSFSVETYNRIRYLFHLACIRPSFSRKIRKCHMRKAVASFKRARKQAARRYGL